jgi:hypothetical protein
MADVLFNLQPQLVEDGYSVSCHIEDLQPQVFDAIPLRKLILRRRVRLLLSVSRLCTVAETHTLNLRLVFIIRFFQL